MHERITIGVDIAKRVFQLHGQHANGTIVFRKKVKRRDFLPLFEKLPPALVGLEACGTGHHWARAIARLGHEVRLLPPSYVKPYVRRGKTDAADAAAIAEAVGRPSLPTVPVKTLEQQSRLVRHRTRELLVAQRTQVGNALRSQMAEFGIVAETGARGDARLLAILHEGNEQLPAIARDCLLRLAEFIDRADTTIAAFDREIAREARSDETVRRLRTIPGVGPLTASAIVATVGDARRFKSGRAFAAWLGLTPRLEGTGGKVCLGPITKQGDRYLRRLLVLGASAVLARARHRPEKYPRAATLLSRMAFRPASVALANGTARIIWALMVRGGEYRPELRTIGPAAEAEKGARREACGAPSVPRVERGRGGDRPPPAGASTAKIERRKS